MEIVSFGISVLASFAASELSEALKEIRLERRFKNKMDAEMQRWAKNLPQDIRNLDAKSLSELQELEAQSTIKRRELYACIRKGVIPSEEVWFHAYLERFDEVVQNTPASERASFYNTSREVASHHLEELAQICQSVCAKNPDIFRAHLYYSIRNVEDYVSEKLHSEQDWYREYVQNVIRKAEELTQKLFAEKIEEGFYQLSITISDIFRENKDNAFNADKKYNIYETLKFLKDNTDKPIILYSDAGTGKSTFLYRLLVSSIEFQMIPFFIDVSTQGSQYWLDAMKASKTSEDVAYHLFGCALGANYQVFKNAISDKKKVLLLIDGINEIPKDVQSELLDKCLRISDIPFVRIVLSNRMLRYNGERKHLEASMIPLKGEGLEQIPFFRDLLSSFGQKSKMDITEAFQKFFLERIFDNSRIALEYFAQTAYSIYETFGTVSATEQEWQNRLDQFTSEENDKTLCEKLVTAGVLRKGEASIDEGKDTPSVLRIWHQLAHDYLGAVYMMSDRQRWTYRSFDVLTLNASSFDAIDLAIEMADDADDADALILKIYDWNLYAVLHCILHNQSLKQEAKTDRELITAILYILSEKRFDKFPDTSKSTTKFLDQITAYDFPTADYSPKSLNELFQHVTNKFEPKGRNAQKLETWKKIFLKQENCTLDEQEFKFLFDGPLIGWTAANAFRRIKLTEANYLQIRTSYYALRSIGGDESQIRRWRLVHILGACEPTAENVQLLIDASKNDKNQWVRYGAIRSLMELAASHSGERSYIFSMLKEILSKESVPKILDLVRKNSILREKHDGDSDWYKSCQTLLTTLKKVIEEDERLKKNSHLETWDDTISRISAKLKT